MSNIQDDIKSVKTDIDKKREELDRLQRLSEKYPDIQKYVGRWNKIAYYSKSVNSKVERFEIRHNCGCCNDSPLELWPYLETPDGNIYSDPPKFVIGERSYDGDVAHEGWKESLMKANIPDTIIGSVETYFKRYSENDDDS